MRKIRFLLALFTFLATLALPAVVHACPSCADAPAAQSGNGDEEGNGNRAAYNNSIYVMVGVPYLSFGIFGFMIYRGMKKNEEYRRAHGWPEQN